MMARNTNVPFKGRIQKRKTHDLLSACNARPVHTEGPDDDIAGFIMALAPMEGAPADAAQASGYRRLVGCAASGLAIDGIAAAFPDAALAID